MLDLVSLTGADDAVDIADLDKLGKEYPFVEWALLYFPGNEGVHRNPSLRWRKAFFDAKVPGRSAVHLCGKLAFEQLLAGDLPSEILKADRIQLNVNARRLDFTPSEVLQIYRSALEIGPTIILQLHEESHETIARFLSSLGEANALRINVLLDGSKGRGVLPATWGVPGIAAQSYCGFAGGIGPDNLSVVLPQLESMGRRFWIDMETGVRTENQFDLVKVRAVLGAVAAAKK